MFIGYLRLSIFIAHSQSLKDRRRVLAALIQRAKNKFNISVAEKPSDARKTSELFFVCTHYTKNYAHQLMEQIETFVRDFGDIQILETDKGVL